MPILGIISDIVVVVIILAVEVMAIRAATLRVASRRAAQNRAVWEACGGFVLMNFVSYLDGYASLSTMLQLAILVIGGSQFLAAVLHYLIFLVHHVHYNE